MVKKLNRSKTRTFYVSKTHLDAMAKIANDRRIGERKPSLSSIAAEAFEFWLNNRPAVSVPGPSSR